MQTRPTFAVGRRRTLFAGNYQTNSNHTNYDRDAHGRFVMLGQTTAGSTTLVVVLKWFEELRQRMREGR